MRQSFGGVWPEVHPDAYVHERAVLIGEVHVGARSTVWPNVSLRGDVGSITIGEDTSIQDGTVGHTTGGRSILTVGSRVTVGHTVILHGCSIGDDCLVGMGAIVMDNAVIEPWTMVGAGSLVPPNKTYPSGVLLIGRPAVVARPLTDAERTWIVEAAKSYVALGVQYRAETPR
jgi:carbonic anhydrase/acetyltransferase-like protein (isoleucine patch superfamily)